MHSQLYFPVKSNRFPCASWERRKAAPWKELFFAALFVFLLFIALAISPKIHPFIWKVAVLLMDFFKCANYSQSSASEVAFCGALDSCNSKWRMGFFSAQFPTSISPLLDLPHPCTWFIPEPARGKSRLQLQAWQRKMWEVLISSAPPACILTETTLVLKKKKKDTKHAELSKMLQIMIRTLLKWDTHFSVSFSFFPTDCLNLGHRRKKFLSFTAVSLLSEKAA